MDEILKRARAEREERHLQRTLRAVEGGCGTEIELKGRKLVNFSSNDYLGLSQHPAVKAAASEATEKYGAGAGAARLVCGNLPVHRELEKTVANFKGTEAALAFNSGYAAAVGAITSLVSGEDVVMVDKLSHASLIDGARLSGAELRVFRHNDVASLEKILRATREKRAEARILIVTESVFSMDGDVAPLAEMVALKNRFGAWLLVDEAHGLGVLGPNRRGLAEELKVAAQIEIQMGTLGKAAGAAGGFIAGSEVLIDHLINSARSFIFSTAPTPAAVAAAQAGLKAIACAEGESLCKKLWENLRAFSAMAKLPTPTSAIIPVMVGEEAKALELSQKLIENGIFVPAIRYPTVPRGKARLRITLSAAHSHEQIARLAEALNQR